MTENIQEAAAALEIARAERDKLPHDEARQALNHALDRVDAAISKAAAARLQLDALVDSWIAAMTERQRLELFERISNDYCLGCGATHPGGRLRCCCWRHE